MVIPSTLSITEILKAAAPIVASVASINADKNKKNETENKDKVVNVTIHNHFHMNSEEEAKHVASKIEEQILKNISDDGNRYML